MFITDNDDELWMSRLLDNCPSLQALQVKYICTADLEKIALKYKHSLRVLIAAVDIDSANVLQRICQGCTALRIFEVTCPYMNESGDAIVKALVENCPHIEIINTGGFLLTDASMHLLATIHTIKGFTLENNYTVTSSAMQSFIQSHTQLDELVLNNCSLLCIDTALVNCIAKHCGNLQKLTLIIWEEEEFDVGPIEFSYTTITDLFNGCPLLVDLTLENLDFDNSTLWTLPQYCPHLQRLRIKNLYGIENSTLSELLEGNCTLTTLDLEFTEPPVPGPATLTATVPVPAVVPVPVDLTHIPLAGGAEEAVGEISQWNDSEYSDYYTPVLICNNYTLTTVHIKGDGIRDSALCDIFEYCHSLIDVHICDCTNMTDKAIYNLGRNNRNLTRLIIEGVDGLSEGCIYEIALGCSKLSILRLTYFTLSDALLQYISTHCPSLTCLNFEKCDDISEVGIFAIVSTCMRLKVFCMTDCMVPYTPMLGLLCKREVYTHVNFMME